MKESFINNIKDTELISMFFYASFKEQQQKYTQKYLSAGKTTLVKFVSRQLVAQSWEKFSLFFQTPPFLHLYQTEKKKIMRKKFSFFKHIYFYVSGLVCAALKAWNLCMLFLIVALTFLCLLLLKWVAIKRIQWEFIIMYHSYYVFGECIDYIKHINTDLMMSNMFKKLEDNKKSISFNKHQDNLALNI